MRGKALSGRLCTDSQVLGILIRQVVLHEVNFPRPASECFGASAVAADHAAGTSAIVAVAGENIVPDAEHLLADYAAGSHLRYRNGSYRGCLG